jgi:phosphoglycerol transferase MdoB-like AlkP superfamily enzyme
MDSLMLKMENAMYSKVDADRKMWFSMWFLGAIVTFGLAFFPMYYRLIKGRNRHFRREAELEKQIAAYFGRQGKKSPATSEGVAERNAKAWAVSIVLIVPVFVILYLLSRDLAVHERNQDAFLAAAFPQKMFMPQTIPIKTYVLITIVTLGVGVVYWLYKVVNLYNAHFKAQLQVEKEISRLMEEEKAVEQV